MFSFERVKVVYEQNNTTSNTDDKWHTVTARPYRFPHALKEELDRQIKEMLEHSNSNYFSPVFWVSKTPDSQENKRYRFVIDFG